MERKAFPRRLVGNVSFFQLVTGGHGLQLTGYGCSNTRILPMRFGFMLHTAKCFKEACWFKPICKIKHLLLVSNSNYRFYALLLFCLSLFWAVRVLVSGINVICGSYNACFTLGRIKLRRDELVIGSTLISA